MQFARWTFDGVTGAYRVFVYFFVNYPNVATLRYFGSLLSQIRLSSVTFVRRTHEVETFGNIFFAILYISHPLTSVQNFTQIVPEELLRRGR